MSDMTKLRMSDMTKLRMSDMTKLRMSDMTKLRMSDMTKQRMSNMTKQLLFGIAKPMYIFLTDMTKLGLMAKDQRCPDIYIYLFEIRSHQIPSLALHGLHGTRI
jgi:hypothetical protein